MSVIASGVFLVSEQICVQLLLRHTNSNIIARRLLSLIAVAAAADLTESKSIQTKLCSPSQVIDRNRSELSAAEATPKTSSDVLTNCHCANMYFLAWRLE